MAGVAAVGAAAAGGVVGAGFGAVTQRYNESTSAPDLKQAAPINKVKASAITGVCASVMGALFGGMTSRPGFGALLGAVGGAVAGPAMIATGDF